MTEDNPLTARAEHLLVLLRNKGLTVATAESCTGGMVAALLTDIPGSSDVVERGFVTYSNAAKAAMLDVPDIMIQRFGAVSPEVARAMAAGALRNSRADLAVSITGIAGPGGGSADKPVGLVHFSAQRRGFPPIHVEKRFGDIGRREVRRAAVEEALHLLEILAGSLEPEVN